MTQWVTMWVVCFENNELHHVSGSKKTLPRYGPLTLSPPASRMWAEKASGPHKEPTLYSVKAAQSILRQLLSFKFQNLPPCFSSWVETLFSATGLPKHNRVIIHPEQTPDDTASPARRHDHILLSSLWPSVYSCTMNGTKGGRDERKKEVGGKTRNCVSKGKNGNCLGACALYSIDCSPCCRAQLSGFWAVHVCLHFVKV